MAIASYTIDLLRVSGEQFTGQTTIGINGSIAEIDYRAPAVELNSAPKFNYGFGPYFAHRLFNPELPFSIETGLELGVKYEFTRKVSMSANFRSHF